MWVRYTDDCKRNSFEESPSIRWAECKLTTCGGDSKESATENIQHSFLCNRWNSKVRAY